MSKKQIISPPSRFSLVDLREVYRYRQLLISLTVRDLKVRYAQTFIGGVWVILQPLFTILLLSFVFQKIAGVSTEGVPPFLYILSGYWAWSYFSSVVVGAGDAIIGAQDMVQKIYFPKLSLPLSKAVSALVDTAIVLVLLALVMIYYRYPVTGRTLFFPFAILATVLCGFAIGTWISAITIRYRDFRFITPFLLQLGLFITPIAYPVDQVPEMYQTIYFLNPMVGIIEFCRWSLLSVGTLGPSVIYSAIMITVLLVTSILYFGNVEKTMADII